MRIAIDARAAAEVPAGRGRYVRELVKGLARARADHEYVLYARTPWSEAPADPRMRWRTFSAPGLAWPLAAGAMMNRGADVALACTSYALTVPWRLPGACIVWDFSPFDRSLSPPRGSGLERVTLPFALRRCGALVTISESVRSELEQRYPGQGEKALVAHPAADARFTPEPGAHDEQVLARHGLSEPYVLVTGTLEPRKNLPRLIDAFAGLSEAERGGRALVLAGAGGWETDATFASVRRHSALVRAIGFVPDDDLPALVRRAELFCYPSLYEGFGIPVLEAMQSGTPVLTSGRSSMPEVGGDAAVYVDPFDVADIRRGLASLLGDPALRERCAAAGVVRARSFSWDECAARVLGALEALAGAQRRASSHTLRR